MASTTNITSNHTTFIGEWGVSVWLEGGTLCAYPGDRPTVYEGYHEVEFACPHFLAEVNAKMGTAFTMSGFEYLPDGCPECEEAYR